MANGARIGVQSIGENPGCVRHIEVPNWYGVRAMAGIVALSDGRDGHTWQLRSARVTVALVECVWATDSTVQSAEGERTNGHYYHRYRPGTSNETHTVIPRARGPHASRGLLLCGLAGSPFFSMGTPRTPKSLFREETLLDAPLLPTASKSPRFDVGSTAEPSIGASKWALLKASQGGPKRSSRTKSGGGGGTAIAVAAARLQDARRREKQRVLEESVGSAAPLEKKLDRERELNWKQMLAEAENAAETIKREQEHMTAEIYLGEAAAGRAGDVALDHAHLSFHRTEKDEQKAIAVVRELLDSEDKYRVDLGRTLEFLKPLVEVFEDNAQEFRTVQGFVANLVRIEQMHTRLGERLDALCEESGDGAGSRPDSPVSAGGSSGAAGSSSAARSPRPQRLPSLQRIASTFTAFIASAPEFDFCYATHADTYENVLDVLKTEREDDDHVQLFLQATDEALRQHGLQWGAALYRPVKRVMDYRGFFERALKYTPPVHTEHVYVREALNLILEVAKHVNELVGDHIKVHTDTSRRGLFRRYIFRRHTAPYQQLQQCRLLISPSLLTSLCLCVRVCCVGAQGANRQDPHPQARGQGRHPDGAPAQALDLLCNGRPARDAADLLEQGGRGRGRSTGDGCVRAQQRCE